MTLPHPVTVTDHYLAAINDRLGKLLDRLDQTQLERLDGTVELREPAASAPASGGKGTAVSRRPSPKQTPTSAGAAGAAPAPREAQKPARRPAGSRTSKKGRDHVPAGDD